MERREHPRRREDDWQYAVRIVGERVEECARRVAQLELLVEKLCFLLRVLTYLGGGILAVIGTTAAAWQAWV